MSTLIFDCDGVLADTERDGHRVAFNRIFAEVGLPVRWSEAEYGSLLAIGGGKERMATLFADRALVREHGLPTDADGQRRLLADWHRRKTEIYTELVAAGRVPARAGVVRLVDEAIDGGWRLAVASTSAEPAVRAVLEHVVGADRAARFAVLAGDVVERKKPDPGIYLLTLERTGTDPGAAIVIEDSRPGLLAAVGAGLRCVVTVNDYTRDAAMDGALLVVTGLGEPDRPMTVLADPAGVRPTTCIELSDLRKCLEIPTREETVT
jgi:HAD superfamily hydrolase (TIGR01509 family)